jgi:hypothetical protein
MQAIEDGQVAIADRSLPNPCSRPKIRCSAATKFPVPETLNSSLKASKMRPSVQLIRKRALRNEASRHQFPNGRGQSKGAGLCGPLVR